MSVMKNLEDITYWTSQLDRNLSPPAIELLHEGLKCDPLTGQNLTSSEWILNHIRPTSSDNASLRGNLVSDKRKRWGLVYRRNLMDWEIRARISQTEGIEITRANYRDNLVTRNHQLVPLTYLLRRSRCRFGPFLCTFRNGFVIAGLFNPGNEFLALQLFWFMNDGRTTSQLYQSSDVFGSFRFSYRIKARSIRYKNGGGIWKQLTSFPYRVDSEDVATSEKILCAESNGNGNCWISYDKLHSWRCNTSNFECNSAQMKKFCISFEVHGENMHRVINGPVLETSQSRGVNNDFTKRDASEKKMFCML